MHDLPRNFLVYRLSALGDVVLTTGVLNYWHERFGWRFHVLTREAFAPVFEHSPVVDRVVAFDGRDLAMPETARRFAALAAEYKGWGLLDLHGTARSALLRFFWKGPVRRYAKFSLERRLFLASNGALYKDALRAANVPQRYAMAVEKTPPPRERLVPNMVLSGEERSWAKSFLAKRFGDDVLKSSAGRVALHPFAAHAYKAWPEGSYRALCAELDAANIPWLVIGKGEALFPGDARDLTNATSLRESAALLAASSALVSGDSGPMHLATAVGTPVIGLFGPTTEEWGFYPSGARDRVLETERDCRPCSLHGKKPCPHAGECMAAITPAEVMAALDAVLSARE